MTLFVFRAETGPEGLDGDCLIVLKGNFVLDVAFLVAPHYRGKHHWHCSWDSVGTSVVNSQLVKRICFPVINCEMTWRDFFHLLSLFFSPFFIHKNGRQLRWESTCLLRENYRKEMSSLLTGKVDKVVTFWPTYLTFYARSVYHWSVIFTLQKSKK